MGDTEQKELRRRNLSAKRLHEGRTGEFRQRIAEAKKSDYKRLKHRELYNLYNNSEIDDES